MKDAVNGRVSGVLKLAVGVWGLAGCAILCRAGKKNAGWPAFF
jgi:hypothetical protein